MIDLHTHSSASDGSYSPGDLVRYALEQGISVLALTDHDTIAGNEEAKKAAEGTGLTFVPGVELNINWKPGECHLLGLGLQTISPDFMEILDRLNNERKARNTEIVKRMQEAGIDVDLERVEEIAGGGTVGRPHFAEFLVKAKVVKTRQAAFDRFLAKDRPFYFSRKSISLEEGISAITGAGGIPVLAHPLSLYVSWSRLEGIIADFRDKGLAGIEAWHPAARVAECERLEKLAKSLGMCVTAGSDFHGMARPDRKIGKTAGGRTISDTYFTDQLFPLLEAQKQKTLTENQEP
ncbi:PHP domain-containing protein [Brucepastera parasyntrophica]|uniref:PHP domain-containing protein n=1 Tax=Brucepastera parasyntrophica TaxID=2880008 RepID=UPI00210EA212|nr:PHP domain-containing protein [Brucepastera parasyntrophica]ULQ59168.1 PHP domain-containing protein [Brucepastera parasyntrophica]